MGVLSATQEREGCVNVLNSYKHDSGVDALLKENLTEVCVCVCVCVCVLSCNVSTVMCILWCSWRNKLREERNE